MFPETMPLRNRIFFSMLLMVLLASLTMVGLTVYQFNKDNRNFHRRQHQLKETTLQRSFSYLIKSSGQNIESADDLRMVIRDRLYELAEINQTELTIYTPDGEFLMSSETDVFSSKTKHDALDPTLRRNLEEAPQGIHTTSISEDDVRIRRGYSYILSTNFKPIGILQVPYIEDPNTERKDFDSFRRGLGRVYLLLLLGAGILAYLLSKGITSPLRLIGEKISDTNISHHNEPITWRGPDEIQTLVNAYNQMVVQLEDSAEKLAASERESAWREMARQVAHEIKNPLTPMRLSVQNYAFRFDPEREDIRNKTNEFCDALIQQIDTLSEIAGAFSDFARMPDRKDENMDLSASVSRTVEIFQNPHIYFWPASEATPVCMDPNLVNRMVTNLLRNAEEAVKDQDSPKITITVKREQSNAVLRITDNGIGMDEALLSRIFEPKFTTRSSGMGLGLPMVRDIVQSYHGHIVVNSRINSGTTIIVTIPLTQQ